MKLKEWARHALETQRCIWGLHRPVQIAEVRPFESWFNRIENKGYVPYDGSTVLSIIRDLVYYHHQLAYDMMQHSTEYSTAEYNEQATKTFRLKDLYKEVSGLEFIFELPCSQDTEACNLRRRADKGANHMHEVKIDLPTKIRLHSYEEAAKLREELLELGILPSSGVVGSIEERVAILRAKLEEHKLKMKKIGEAQDRLRLRPARHQKERAAIQKLYNGMSTMHCAQACDAGDISKVLVAIRRGSDPNTETARGITPLICLVLNDGRVDDYEELAKLGANFDAVNKNGATALGLACVLQEVKHVHGCLKNGADLSHLDILKRSAVHWCALHSSEDCLQVLLNYSAEEGRNAKDILDSLDIDGNSALALAALHRNGLMCKILYALGADPALRNSDGKTASILAREKGFDEIADWLDRRMGAGVVRLQSSDDVSFEKELRYGAIKARENINRFISLYSRCVDMNVKHQWLVDAAQCKQDMSSRQSACRREQSIFVNRHRNFLSTSSEFSDDLRAILEATLTTLKSGRCNPNVEGICGLIHWTPLMCAVALNDLRLIRLFVKEGASINFGNRYGVNSLMLASWLNNVDALAELLVLGGDILLKDNQGFTAKVYAALLPPCEELSKNLLEVSVIGRREIVKLLSTSDVLLNVQRYGANALPGMIAENRNLYLKSIVKTPSTELLEKYGLTNTDDRGYNFQCELAYLENRMNRNTAPVVSTSKVSESGQITQSVYRCHLCTLAVPCSHFASIASLIKQQAAGENGLIKLENPRKYISPFQKELSASLKVYSKSPEVILLEADLADRRTDRNKLLVDEFRQRFQRMSLQKRDRITREASDLSESDRIQLDSIIKHDLAEATNVLPQIDDKGFDRQFPYNELSELSVVFTFPHSLRQIDPVKSAIRSDAYRKTKRTVRFALPVDEPREYTARKDDFLRQHMVAYRRMQADFLTRRPKSNPFEDKFRDTKA